MQERNCVQLQKRIKEDEKQATQKAAGRYLVPPSRGRLSLFWARVNEVRERVKSHPSPKHSGGSKFLFYGLWQN
jgi:hypothetical protein